MCTKHVEKIQNVFVKVLVMCEYVLEPAKTILNNEQQSFAIFHSLVHKLENVFHSMLNVKASSFPLVKYTSLLVDPV